jgi:N,N'-diacetylbacillosaminyl-diphospho-undecaprenol alpha-1,3-N-acetylgalactosaminyltransferase
MKILLIGNEAFSMFHFRKDLISGLINRGYDITVIVPPGDYVSQIMALGCKVHTIQFSRFISPLQDLLLFLRLVFFLKRNKYDIVHNITIKPNIYGGLAAYLCGVPKIVSLISGLGYIFQETTSFKKKILTPIVSFLYRLSLRLNTKVWFQNPDDMADFVSKGLVSPDKTVLLYGSGINLEEFQEDNVTEEKIKFITNKLGIIPGEKIVLMVTARLILTKGLLEFIEASRKCKNLKGWRFLMVSPLDEGTYDSVDVEEMKKLIPSNLIWESDFHSNIKTFFKMASIVVLPSKVREGVPRSLIEALAFSKPVVTTNVIGCREVVESGVNGYLVPPGDADALANAISDLALDDKKREIFGQKSRILAEKKFSHKNLIRDIQKKLYEIT